jgi:hypothetical protein
LVSIRLYPAPAAEIQVESLGLPNAAPAPAYRMRPRADRRGDHVPPKEAIPDLFDGNAFQAEARGLMGASFG